MSIGRNILIPIVLALATTGSVMGGVAASASAAQASVAQAHAAVVSGGPNVHYHT